MAMSSDQSSPSSGSSSGRTKSRQRERWILVFRYGELAKEVTAKSDCSPKFGLEVVCDSESLCFCRESKFLMELLECGGYRSRRRRCYGSMCINFTLVVEKEVADLIQVVMWVLRFAGALLVLVEWAKPPSACLMKLGLLWLIRCGLVCRVFACFLFFVLHCLLLQLVLGFSFVFRSQISHGSFESGLLSGISVETWFWVVGHFSVRPNLLVTFSYEIDY